jgi:hypothetical protein
MLRFNYDIKGAQVGKEAHYTDTCDFTTEVFMFFRD